MSLLKPRVITVARRAANRRNAQKSTGPRTASGKAQSRLNGLRHGFCSPAFRQFWLALFESSPGSPVAKTVRTLLTPEQSCHPVYADLIDVHFEMEMIDRADTRPLQRRRAKEELASPSEAKNLLKTMGRAKTRTSRS